MKLLGVLREILSHPLNRQHRIAATLRFIRWQISARLRPSPIVHQLTGRSRLLVARGMTGATGNLYCGLHEFFDMGFLLHFLRPSDLFLDVGANVGSYTVLAAAEVGARAIAVEPAPAAFETLKANVALNGAGQRVVLKNVAVGGQRGTLAFTRSQDTVNHITEAGDADAIEVSVETLDGIVEGDRPALIKMDVEGYELEVLRGARLTLGCQEVKALIVELNGSGERYGFTDDEVHRELLGYGFAPFAYEPRSRRLSPLTTFGPRNTIYIRDLPVVAERLRSARPIAVGNISL